MKINVITKVIEIEVIKPEFHFDSSVYGEFISLII